MDSWFKGVCRSLQVEKSIGDEENVKAVEEEIDISTTSNTYE